MEGEVDWKFYAPQLEGGYWQEKPAGLYLHLFRISANEQLLPLLTIAECLERLPGVAAWGDQGYKSLKHLFCAGAGAPKVAVAVDESLPQQVYPWRACGSQVRLLSEQVHP